jgi:acid phosphatase type 7
MTRYLPLALLIACSSKTEPTTSQPTDTGVVEDSESPACDLAVSKGPWVVAVDATSAKVRWESCRSGGGAITIAGKRIDSKVSQAIVTTTNDVPLARTSDPAGTYFMHEVAVTGLPSGCHDYTIEQDATAKGRLCTARKSGDTFSFAAIGDTNPGLGDISKMLTTVYDQKPDFTIHQGDIQYYSSGLESYTSWMEKMRPMLRTGAFYPSIGNHESEQPKEREEYVERFWGKPGFDGNSDFYRFESGGVWFFALNTEIDMGDKSSQGTWLATQLDDASKKPGFRFSVLYMHRPFVTCGDTGQNDALRKTYQPLFTRTGVKLVVAGHMHGYERFEFDDTLWITSAGGGSAPGKVDENITRPECADRKASGVWWNATLFTVKPGELSGTTYDDKGAVRDTFMRAVP